MRLKNLKGKLVSKNVAPYRIDWDGKSRSKIQFSVKQFLKKYWKNHIVYEEFPVYGSLMKVDILNATKMIAVEVNGDQHGEFNEFFHNNSRNKYQASIIRDFKKLEWLESNNFQVIEINEDEVEDVSLDFIKKKFGIDIV
jgi:hypothetical protein